MTIFLIFLTVAFMIIYTLSGGYLVIGTSYYSRRLYGDTAQCFSLSVISLVSSVLVPVLVLLTGLTRSDIIPAESVEFIARFSMVCSVLFSVMTVFLLFTLIRRSVKRRKPLFDGFTPMMIGTAIALIVSLTLTILLL